MPPLVIMQLVVVGPAPCAAEPVGERVERPGQPARRRVLEGVRRRAASSSRNSAACAAGKVCGSGNPPANGISVVSPDEREDLEQPAPDVASRACREQVRPAPRVLDRRHPGRTLPQGATSVRVASSGCPCTSEPVTSGGRSSRERAGSAAGGRPCRRAGARPRLSRCDHRTAVEQHAVRQPDRRARARVVRDAERREADRAALAVRPSVDRSLRGERPSADRGERSERRLALPPVGGDDAALPRVPRGCRGT